MKELKMSDIAKISGVSIKTVSRIVNNSKEVKEETRKKVLDVINKYNYKVNLLAKGLKSKKTNTIILFIDRHGGRYWSMWHNEVIRIIIKKLQKQNYKLLVSPSSGKGFLYDDTDGFYFLKSRMADGAIILDNIKNDIRIKYLLDNNIPFVTIGKDIQNKISYVDADNFKIGYLGGEYLVSKGYSNICFFLGGKEFIVNQERVNGFKKACNKSKSVKININFNINNSKESYKKTLELIEKFSPDAFFISGDERVLGVYKALNEKKIKIPDNVAILGIDNLPIGDYLLPPLSSIDQPREELASHVINILIDHINNKTKKAQKVLIEPRLVIREST